MVRSMVATALKGENSKSYEDAVKTLNTLQTNAQTLEKIRQDRDKFAHLNIPNMLKFAKRAGIVEADMDKLNVIHVSGTKGKGSTCAYCESILRHHGYKTGFFSSPHLVEVRERFCVNGESLEREKFASYFWDVYNKLDQSKADHDGTMPNYFGFLTVMALHVFLREEVDVAVMEVGIGGTYDCTNLIRNPVVCGVTSLGLDHTSILGTSIDKIAWHKAGIFKPGVPAFTAPQVPEAMQVLRERSIEIGAPLSVCPDISRYETKPRLGIKGTIQQLNASLSLQLCHTWMDKHKEKTSTDMNGTTVESPTDRDHTGSPSPAKSTRCDVKQAPTVTLTPQYLLGLEKCQWLGRNQTIREPGLTFYVDGAHTQESIEQCVDWFKSESKDETSKDGVYRVLIFNTTGDRESNHLLQPLLSCQFDAALFCPNIAYEKAMSADQTNNTVTKDSQLRRCLQNKDSWDHLSMEWNKHKNSGINSAELANGHIVNGALNVHSEVDRVHQNQCQDEVLESHAFPSISHCINWVCKRNQVMVSQELNKVELTLNGDNSLTNVKVVDSFIGIDKKVSQNVTLGCGDSRVGYLSENGVSGVIPVDKRHIQVLIAGSIHLVGGALRVIWDRQS